MFKHEKATVYHVRVGQPDPRFAVLLHEQFGGPNGELKAGMQYLIQSFSCNDPRIRDLMQDVAAEELGHFEMVGECIALLLGDMNHVPPNFPAPFLAVEGGGPMLIDAAGAPWTGNYINANGDLFADLRSNVAAEMRAKLVYERLLQQTDDPGVRDMIRFLLSREESHATSFTQALSSLPEGTGVIKDFRDSSFSKKYFNLSTGDEDARGPWNQGHGFQYETNPHKNYGSMPQYGIDMPVNGPREIGPAPNLDHTRNNPTWQQAGGAVMPQEQGKSPQQPH